ncbi:MAG: hypothetical protein KatS3mg110_2240 [Pirellulaceae bacterium]|nr:MAG: hypothetical protein KatS3mg110_2240 [Pirellulaceae bacterium]
MTEARLTQFPSSSLANRLYLTHPNTQVAQFMRFSRRDAPEPCPYASIHPDPANRQGRSCPPTLPELPAQIMPQPKGGVKIDFFRRSGYLSSSYNKHPVPPQKFLKIVVRIEPGPDVANRGSTLYVSLQWTSNITDLSRLHRRRRLPRWVELGRPGGDVSCALPDGRSARRCQPE